MTRIDGWIAKHLDDPEAIRAFAVRPVDERTAEGIRRVLSDPKTQPAPSFCRAWEIILMASQDRRRMLRTDWYDIVRRIKSGENSSSVRNSIAEALRPSLQLSKPYGREVKRGDKNAPLWELLSIGMEPMDYPSATDILKNWPDDDEKSDALLGVLSQTFLDALETAELAELISPKMDKTSLDVRSVAPDSQDKYSDGFYQIIRMMADLFDRLAASKFIKAKRHVAVWIDSKFVLARRLAYYAYAKDLFVDKDLSRLADAVSPDDLFGANARRELFKLFQLKWDSLPDATRSDLDRRICQGPPESPDEADPEYVAGVQFLALSMIVGANKKISASASSLLEQLRESHPKWEIQADERELFHMWSESRRGPAADVSVLDKVLPSELVGKAFELKNADPINQHDLWRQLSAGDPDRAFEALSTIADSGTWIAEAWKEFFWEFPANAEPTLVSEIVRKVLSDSEGALATIASTIAHWLQQQHKHLSDEPPGFFEIWDHLSAQIFSGQANDPGDDSDPGDILNHAINEGAGFLSYVLFLRLVARAPKVGDGIDPDLRQRFDFIATATENAGLLARVVSTSKLSYLYQVDPEWCRTNLIPNFSSAHPDAMKMWSAWRYDNPFSVELLAEIREPFLTLFEQENLDRDVLRSMTERLIIAALLRKDSHPSLEIDSRTIRKALRSAGEKALRTAAWILLRRLRETEEGNRGQAWIKVIGPTFQEIWPLDADLRESKSSEHLVDLALLCEGGFPAAVQVLRPFVVPYATDSIEFDFGLDEKGDDLLNEHPGAMLELIGAAVGDPSQPPGDLQMVLNKLRDADPTLASKGVFRRLEKTARSAMS